MELQRILRKRYMDTLISGIKSGEWVHLFRNSEFQIDDKNTLIMPHLKKPLGLLGRMSAENDFEAAFALFEAYDKLTPIEAADPRFWNYLAIIDLYPYLRERWPNVYKRKEGTNEEGYIMEHFLLEKSSQLLRNWLSGMWWSVYLSVDEKNSEDKYWLTKVLFWNQTLRTRTMGTYQLARKKEIIMGFLEYCLERGKSNFGNFEKEHQDITEFLNRLGGAKPLSIFSRDEVKSILFKKFPITNEEI
ncbi:DUF6339 family protein [Mariniradius sediminis]|uniref:DUF6339 family protein n=1 Tax=Mariniradius sediminis TaxID=2909237 RepID=A0ABS9BNK2_9BACT|nr:DUF6339 family protein [Mariniradius sediminis]MCF1749597.1 DUF6339 family protein [Mariniradius sediminis]